jgi:hypothetical protein
MRPVRLKKRWLLATWIILFLAASVAGHVRADIYMVIGSPRPIDVRAGETIVAAQASAAASAPPQHVFIQLALLGPIVTVRADPENRRRFLPTIEDCPSWLVPKAIPPVTTLQLAQAQQFLEHLGFTSTAVATRLFDLPGKSCNPGSPGVPATIGQILLDVEPADLAHLQNAVDTISAAIRSVPNLAPAGVVLRRDACDVEDRALLQARSESKRWAQMLAQTAGLTLTQWKVNHGSLDLNLSPNGLQQLCAGAQPIISPEHGGLNRFMTYSVWAHVAVAADANPARKVASITLPRFVESSTTFGLYGQGILQNGFRIPTNIPFVSAQGVFRALIVPDVTLEMFSVPGNNPQAYFMLERLAAALRRRDISYDDIRLHKAPWPYLVVRIRATTEQIIDDVYRAANNTQIWRGYEVFVRDCDLASQEVAQRAFALAEDRAETISSAAGLHKGRLIALDDGGQMQDAICGYDSKATTNTLDSAAAHYQHFSGRFAEFGSAVAAAWELAGASVASSGTNTLTFAPPFAETNINESFITTGASVLGSATVPARFTRAYVVVGAGSVTRLVRLPRPDPASAKQAITRMRAQGALLDHLLFRDDQCAQEDMGALKLAVADGLRKIRPAPVHAILDQGIVYSPEKSICGLGSEGGYNIAGSYSDYDRVPYTITHRILVVKGI